MENELKEAREIINDELSRVPIKPNDYVILSIYKILDTLVKIEESRKSEKI